MKLILRLDVDIPFGNHTLFRKVISKIFEITDFHFINNYYLDHVREIISILNSHNIKAIFYFRNCTYPDLKTKKMLLDSGHKIGFHCENTKSFITFQDELYRFLKKADLSIADLHSISKHGSGRLKLGKYHYPPYEPDKYIEWCHKLKIKFLFGNGIIDNDTQLSNSLTEFQNDCYWTEPWFRSHSVKHISDIFVNGDASILPLIAHPENLIRDPEVMSSLIDCIHYAKLNNYEWIDPGKLI